MKTKCLGERGRKKGGWEWSATTKSWQDRRSKFW